MCRKEVFLVSFGGLKEPFFSANCDGLYSLFHYKELYFKDIGL